jgi:hypothetical protein
LHVIAHDESLGHPDADSEERSIWPLRERDGQETAAQRGLTLKGPIGIIVVSITAAICLVSGILFASGSSR